MPDGLKKHISRPMPNLQGCCGDGDGMGMRREWGLKSSPWGSPYMGIEMNVDT